MSGKCSPCMASTELEEELPHVSQFEQSEINEELQLESPRHGRCCKCNYRARRFSSKAALLVLIWNMLSNTVFGTQNDFYSLFYLDEEPGWVERIASLGVPFILLILSALLSGWLADVYLGHYRVAKVGFILLFASTVLQCLLVVVLEISGENFSMALRTLSVSVSVSLSSGSVAMLLVNLPQLGLDQMPDSSTESITSFIVWYVASFFVGYWIGEFASTIGFSCAGENFVVVSSLLPVVFTALVLISDIFLTPKWLIINPKSPQAMKTLYKILKFASKHKAPLNRSALTYWEEDIPSRIDLGKSRYGGPFTTEQVEDVKTFLRILVLTIPLWISLFSFYMYRNTIGLLKADPIVYLNGTVQHCSTDILKYFTYNWYFWAIILVVAFEVTIYPLVGHKLPSSIRRVGASFCFIIIANTFCFSLAMYYFFNPYIPPMLAYVHSLGVALIAMVLLYSVVEFVCAQSPYSMQGIILGYVWCINSCTLALADVVYYMVRDDETISRVVLVHSIVATLLSFIGFVLFCVLAHWYKRRVRDDILTPHKWAEDYYDRYPPHETKAVQ